ncbi:hypothetical protein PIB30_079649 [Stylosanthes scabra]|uniref:Uncharacterized protein n=1 Tax=Stylosanthes scabra TaxID=79078 RepID=A0ABU6QSF2_9FABA|nr:hypothetical protein [Stylosanthes scabra]
MEKKGKPVSGSGGFKKHRQQRSLVAEELAGDGAYVNDGDKTTYLSLSLFELGSNHNHHRQFFHQRRRWWSERQQLLGTATKTPTRRQWSFVHVPHSLPVNLCLSHRLGFSLPFVLLIGDSGDATSSGRRRHSPSFFLCLLFVGV